MSNSTIQFPSRGKSRDDVLSAMQAARQADVRWQDGKAFSLVYYAGEEVSDLVKEAYEMFFSENALNPTAFPSLRKFEAEVIAMCASLLGGDENVSGTMTSGGTESLLMAVKTAREWGRNHKPEANLPEMVLSSTAHPAFEKAAHYFGVRPVHVPVGDDFRAQVDLMEAAITPNTILIVGSAPSYPQGVVDPIADLAAIAKKHQLLFHVDACVGGFMLPFVRKLGYTVPDFDFQSPWSDLYICGFAQVWLCSQRGFGDPVSRSEFAASPILCAYGLGWRYLCFACDGWFASGRCDCCCLGGVELLGRGWIPGNCRKGDARNRSLEGWSGWYR